MRKKTGRVFRILAVVAAVILICYSFGFSYYVRNLKNLEPRLVNRGELKFSASVPHEFKYEVCKGLVPFKVKSDLPHDDISAENLCLVTYRGKRLVVGDSAYLLKATKDFFNHGLMKFSYGGKPIKELMELALELQEPPQSYFYFLPKHFQEGLIYTLSSLGRLSKTESFEKFTYGDKIIYRWISLADGERPSSYRIEVLSDGSLIKCMGDECLDYLKEIKVI